MTPSKDDIVWAWNTTKLSAGQIGLKYGVSRSAILGIVHRDPRAKRRKPPTVIQVKDRRIKALEAEVARLQELEAAVLKRPGLRKGKKANMEAQFWKAMRKALYEEGLEVSEAVLTRMERKAAA